MQNSVTRVPSWLVAHGRGAALVACGIAAIFTWRWNHDKDPERAAQTKERDTHTLAKRISKYARDMQERYPTGTVVVSEEDLAGALHRTPGRSQKPSAFFRANRRSSAPRSPATGS